MHISTAAIIVGCVALASLAIVGARAWTRLAALSDKKRKKRLVRMINRVFTRSEERGWLTRTPAFIRDYHRYYPALARLEAGYPQVRAECLAILEDKERLPDIRVMGGNYTKRGVHLALWKTFLFKSGDFVEANCARCPRTAALLRDIPHVYTAFFSVLDPHQVITPHWGYYKGFLRYHLGVVIPNDNADRSCSLQVNADLSDNAQDDPALIEKGERYYWHEGEGIVFNDNYLHGAENKSDEVRVVLFLDLKRPMPWPLDLFNRLCLWIAHRERGVRKIRENALLAD